MRLENKIRLSKIINKYKYVVNRSNEGNIRDSGKVVVEEILENGELKDIRIVKDIFKEEYGLLRIDKDDEVSFRGWLLDEVVDRI